MPDTATRQTSKAAQIRAYLADGNVRAAVLLAASFQDLGDQRGAILSAREAYLRPDFQRQLGRDPEVLIASGREALRVRYGA
jgi:hypothetical protein